MNKHKNVKHRKEDIDFDYRSLESIQAEIEHFIDFYGKDAMIETYNKPFDDDKYYAVFVMEQETDEEFNIRVAAENKRRVEKNKNKVELEKREAAEYARLQKKFGEKK